ncbi:MAG: MATE family efflux transporter [Planctomycetota bacterium]|nr:MATE family efflux transporter [Planctomycetota bacterium]
MPEPLSHHPEKQRSALIELLAVAAPTVATMTSYTVMTFTDKWLVSHLGADYVGAQGNGGLAAWVPQSVAYGALQVINTYAAQNLGAGKPDRAAAYAWNGAWIAIAWWIIVLVPYSFLLPGIFRAAEVDPQQAAWAASYGQILLLGAVVNLCTRALANFFYGLHRASVVLIAGISANIINLIISAVLIFGPGPIAPELGLLGEFAAWIARNLGLPRLGITGSAYGTVIATLVELAIPLAIFLSPAFNQRFRTRAAWRISLAHIKDIARIGWPGGLNFANEMLCWGFFMVYLVSHFGRLHASAGWIAHQYMSLSFMPAVGMSVACTAIVGKYMGMGRPEIAERRAWLAVAISAAYMGICAIAFVIFRERLIGFFVAGDTPPEDLAELVRLGSMMLIATAAFQLFDAAAMVISGALRGAGDTVWPGIATVFTSWIVIVGGGIFMIRVFPGLESIGPWIAAASYIIILCCILVFRFQKGRWKTMKLLERSASAH